MHLPDAAAPAPRVLITGGPTAEDIDPVRYITNRSSGRMGIELALAVRAAGGTPLLILGPTMLAVPEHIACIRVRSAADMCAAVVSAFPWCQSLVMAAAVADYTPAEPLDSKLKKGDGDLVLRLKRTPDILRTIMDLPERNNRMVIGFSLDIGLNLDEGKRKLVQKNLDAIVVNTTASFGADQEEAWLLTQGHEEKYGAIDKARLAEKIVRRIGEFCKGTLSE